MSEFREKYADFIEKQKRGENFSLIYRLGKCLFLIPLAEVVDVVTEINLKNVPGSVDFFKGLFLYEGIPVILIDTFIKLGIENEKNEIALLLNFPLKEPCGFTISSIVQVVPHNDTWERLLKPDEKYGVPADKIERLFKINNNTILQLKLNSLIS